MNPKGQLQISFHFIFAVVGGILFLLFFFVLIKSMIGSQEDQDVRGLSFKVETIIKSAATSPDLTFTVTNLPKAKYEFVCDMDAFGIESYPRINDGDYPSTEVFRYTSVFAPRVVEGDRLFALTRTWEAPFPIGNLLLLSNNRTRFVFIGQNMNVVQWLHQLKEDENLGGFDIQVLPATSADWTTFKDEGHDQYRFIYFRTGGHAFNGNNDLGVRQRFDDRATILSVNLDQDKQGGELTFYDDIYPPGGTAIASSTVEFHGSAMLLAAVFADSATFDCNMAKALERLNGATQILKKRLDLMAPGMSVDCAAIYGRAPTVDMLLGQYVGVNDLPGLATLFGHAGTLEQLEQRNREIRARECPLIY